MLKTKIQAPVFILGMHRSGTTMVAQALASAGVYTGAICDHNAEPLYAIDINERLLEEANGNWWNVPADAPLEAAVQSGLSELQARDLYAAHREKSHFNDLVDFTISGPVELMIISGGDSTPDDFRAFAMEHIRPKYTETQRRNGIHTSDNPDSAMREIEIFESYFS